MKKLLLSLSLFSIGFAANAQWVAQASGFTDVNRGIDEIHVIDANTVWCTAYDGVTTSNNVQEFTKTIDGGTTWVPGLIDIGDTTLKIGNLTAVNGTTAWVSAFDNSLGLGGVWNTTDSGVTWTQQNTTAFTGATSWCDGVHFFDANNGVAFGDPASSSANDLEAYRTTDGGATWTSLAAAMTNIIPGDFGYAGSFAAVGNAMWITTAKGKVYRTLDKGATWTRLNSPIADFGGGDTATSSGRLYFSDANNGILIGNTLSGTTITARKLYKTTDGGSTWSAGVAYTQPYNYNICYVPGTTMLVGTGVASSVYSSALSLDNGTTWTVIESGTQRTTVGFASTTTGWAGGFNSDAFTGGIFKFSGNLANQQFANNSFKVYPNPSSSFVTISSEQLDSFKLKVTDLTGKVMLTQEFSGIENTVDVSSFATGLYFFEINSGSKSETIKIMKN
ncbi:T9SS type A sorting domain-containing protein [Flavobacterium sp.]|uniref:T9SS type A sorting domain-containing protein n=1 Tax=Flavobacterium sp. TaxID=239 RepID=UPI002FDB5A61